MTSVSPAAQAALDALDQAMQSAETLRDCWIERTGLSIEDDPFVKDACFAIRSIRSERLASLDWAGRGAP